MSFAAQPSRQPVSLEVLRAESRDERRVLIEERLLAGDDPWEFMQELPSVDELVVLVLRADMLDDPGARPTAAESDVILRTIAREHPPLAPAVWGMLSVTDRIDPWRARVRGRG